MKLFIEQWTRGKWNLKIRQVVSSFWVVDVQKQIEQICLESEWFVCQYGCMRLTEMDTVPVVHDGIYFVPCLYVVCIPGRLFHDPFNWTMIVTHISFTYQLYARCWCTFKISWNSLYNCLSAINLHSSQKCPITICAHMKSLFKFNCGYAAPDSFSYLHVAWFQTFSMLCLKLKQIWLQKYRRHINCWSIFTISQQDRRWTPTNPRPPSIYESQHDKPLHQTNTSPFL